MKAQDIRIVLFFGSGIQQLIRDLARFRIEIFAEYPFLYAGDFEYEMKYLNKFSFMEDAIAVAAYDKEEIIGIATGYPFRYEADCLKKSFIISKKIPDEYFCLGELMVQKPYRGAQIGAKLLFEVENFAVKLRRYRYMCLYTALRPTNDPLKPVNYKSPDAFWKRAGFVKHSELTGMISYLTIGDLEETEKQMVFWTKKI